MSTLNHKGETELSLNPEIKAYKETLKKHFFRYVYFESKRRDEVVFKSRN